MKETKIDITYLQNQIAALDDQAAYKKLFTHFGGKLIRFSSGFVKSREVAEEIVSDVFIKIWINRKNLPAIRNLPVYLYVCTKNLSLNYRKKLDQQYTFCFEDLNLEDLGLSSSPEQLYISGEMVLKINQAIQSLPPKCQLIFQMVKENDLHYQEVAEILELSVKTIESQMGIAFKRLSKAIQPDLHYCAPGQDRNTPNP
ncbi:MAG: RNA polymerase sigma-70 factor [Chitinophagaceae bacterium]